MKKSLTFLTTIFVILATQAQSPIGAWESTYISSSGTPFKSVVIFTEGYQVLTTYDAKTGKFKSTNGGSWSLDGDVMTEVVEFHSNKPEKVGAELSFKVVLTDRTLFIESSNQKFTRIDHGKLGAVQGAWLMSGRVRNGETQPRDTSRPRKTMKILSGTRFQWIAYNTQTKEFKGTGGGTYTTEDGTYTENIEFFSKDISRVGARLEFTYELKDGDWHHSGLSSKGNPIYEIWSLRD